MAMLRGGEAVLILLAITLGCGRPLVSGDEVGEETSSTEADETTETTTDSEPDCGGFSLDPEYVPPVVMLVVDTSSSMALESWDADGDPQTPEVTRWSSARASVEALIGEFGESPLVGVQRFPSEPACPDAVCTDADACLVEASPEVAPASGMGPAILAALPEADAGLLELAGGSPTSAAFATALEHLLALPSEGRRSIVLLTDGGANCGEGLGLPDSFEVYDESLVARVGDAFADEGIATYVLGVDVGMGVALGEESPQIDTFAALNQVALAGGMPMNLGMEAQKFYGPDQIEALAEAVLNPFASDPTCEIDLTFVSGEPPNPEQIPVVVIEMDGSQVPLVTDCENEDGWTWIVEGEVLSLCGSWCELFLEGTAVEGMYGCGGTP